MAAGVVSGGMDGLTLVMGGFSEVVALYSSFVVLALGRVRNATCERVRDGQERGRGVR